MTLTLRDKTKNRREGTVTCGGTNDSELKYGSVGDIGKSPSSKNKW